MTESPKRKLAAIMFTDMVGYTAMMQKEESKAREIIERHRTLMKPLVEKHGGTILQYVGDGTFCTFDSAIEAVSCAMEIQRALAIEDEINLRMGIHVGDVVSKGDEVYGDGVNVASRLEPLAEPGGVCISGRVYDDIRNQSNMDAKFLGEKVLKNVDHPIKIYCLRGEGLTVSNPFEEEEKAVIELKEVDEPILKPASKKLLPWAAGAVVLLVLFFAKGWFSGESSITEVTADENSLAVMFIENMTDPTDADRSAEMIRMLLSTDLSQAQSLRVISTQRLYDIAKRERKKNGVLIDRSNATNVAKQARARWMLTGTFSKVGSRLLLITELEDVWEGKIIHSQRADGGDIFSLVDALSSEIRSDMGVIATAGEIDAPVKEITTSSSVAYQLYLEGLDFLNESNFKEAIERFQSAVELDSTFNKALYKLAVAQWWSNGRAFKEIVKRMMVNKDKFSDEELLLVQGLDAISRRDYLRAKETYQQLLLKYPDDKEIHYGMGEAYFHSGEEERLKALDSFERVLELDPEFTLAYRHIFDIYNLERMYDRGIRRAKELIALHPERSSGYKELGRMYSNNGEFELALENYQKLLELNPIDFLAMGNLAWTYHLKGNYTKAIEIHNKLLLADIPIMRRFDVYFNMAFAYAEQGKFKEGIEVLKVHRKFTRQISIDHETSTLFTMAIFNSRREDSTTTIGFIDSALALGPSPRGVIFAKLVKGLFYANRNDQITLENTINELQELLNKDTYPQYFHNTYNILQIERYHLQGDIDSALSEFHNIRDSKEWVDWSLYRKAMLYLEKKDFDQSITVTKAMQAPDISKDHRAFNYPYAFYVRGMVYEELGKLDLAIENYEALLELWKDADEEIPERRDTIKRLAALKKSSSS